MHLKAVERLYFIDFTIFTTVYRTTLLKHIFMQELIQKIEAECEAFKADANLQAEKGNKAAGTRARKAALEVMKLMKEFRKVSVEESKK